MWIRERRGATCPVSTGGHGYVPSARPLQSVAPPVPAFEPHGVDITYAESLGVATSAQHPCQAMPHSVTWSQST
ncbi:hypothetical protein GCM10023335_52290 [Streptomyces siamensis]|uniref:Uncharacterized protein n=1 Tax=Streptomyces siamensis TaxID=1274986 RepID=A0ABP9J7J6_9ACTN